MTIGRYQRTNQPIPIIGKTADTNYRCISGFKSIHVCACMSVQKLTISSATAEMQWASDHYAAQSTSQIESRLPLPVSE